ncbi:hypothetical protein [Chitinimonas lacunae]|uniref:Uncharacterized protein n=1 Tax=Chitinimonas lacunae TaxID=1963018 RepID=A0ABV8MQF1_9NEIS
MADADHTAKCDSSPVPSQSAPINSTSHERLLLRLSSSKTLLKLIALAVIAEDKPADWLVSDGLSGIADLLEEAEEDARKM